MQIAWDIDCKAIAFRMDFSLRICSCVLFRFADTMLICCGSTWFFPPQGVVPSPHYLVLGPYNRTNPRTNRPSPMAQVKYTGRFRSRPSPMAQVKYTGRVPTKKMSVKAVLTTKMSVQPALTIKMSVKATLSQQKERSQLAKVITASLYSTRTLQI